MVFLLLNELCFVLYQLLLLNSFFSSFDKKKQNKNKNSCLLNLGMLIRTLSLIKIEKKLDVKFGITCSTSPLKLLGNLAAMTQ